MCRIAGIYRTDNQSVRVSMLAKMRDSMQHGGPDDADIFIDTHLGFAHRRLSILDLSEKGKQPMHFGDWVVSYNGEIYNFQELKKELSDYEFNTETDTEILLKLIDKFGLKALKKCNGMFAISLWNRRTQTLYLTRDRLGIKPLYIFQKDNLILFSSEIKAFFQHPQFDKRISKKAISKYLQYGYFPEEYSVFEYVKKVPPGVWLVIKKAKISSETWYTLTKPCPKRIINISEANALQELEEKLTIAAQKRLISDVPVGLFLSGGTDSSLIAAVLSKQLSSPLKTFTIGIPNSEYDESKQAAAIAKKLGTEHETLLCTPNDFRAIVEKLPHISDMPFGDSSIIPTYLISQKAREKVTVCLSGDGGDEILGGYSKYAATYHYYPKIKGLQYLSGLLDTDNSFNLASAISIFSSSFAGKATKFGRAISANNNYDFFQKSSQYLSQAALEKIHIRKDRYEPFDKIADKSLVSFLGYSDLKSFTEGDILSKVDRASMQHGLEVRVPFLDHELVEFALSLPNHLKISRNTTTKYLSKKLLEKYLPQNLIYTRKKGFSVPVLKWLKAYYAQDLNNLKIDRDFHLIFGFKSVGLESLIDRFLTKKYIAEGYVVWFIFCLYRWYVQIYKELPTPNLSTV